MFFIVNYASTKASFYVDTPLLRCYYMEVK